MNVPFVVVSDGAENGKRDHVAVHGEQELVEAGVERHTREHLQTGVAELHDDERDVHGADAVRLGRHHAGGNQRLLAFLPFRSSPRHDPLIADSLTATATYNNSSSPARATATYSKINALRLTLLLQPKNSNL